MTKTDRHTHTHTHTCTHARTHARMHTHTSAHARAKTCARTHVQDRYSITLCKQNSLSIVSHSLLQSTSANKHNTTNTSTDDAHLIVTSLLLRHQTPTSSIPRRRSNWKTRRIRRSNWYTRRIRDGWRKLANFDNSYEVICILIRHFHWGVPWASVGEQKLHSQEWSTNTSLL